MTIERLAESVSCWPRTGPVLFADAHLALLVTDNDVVLTSDELDIGTLLGTRGIRATVHAV